MQHPKQTPAPDISAISPPLPIETNETNKYKIAEINNGGEALCTWEM
jgi:hypothetical protein